MSYSKLEWHKISEKIVFKFRYDDMQSSKHGPIELSVSDTVCYSIYVHQKEVEEKKQFFCLFDN